MHRQAEPFGGQFKIAPPMFLDVPSSLRENAEKMLQEKLREVLLEALRSFYFSSAS